MAKAKKQQTDSQTPAGSGAPAKTPRKTAAKGGKTKAAEAKKAAAPPAAPMIDTELAASAAAKMLIHKDQIAAAQEGAANAPESAAFKQLKESLHKPGGQATPSFLQSLTPAKKFNASPNRHQQIGRNQTFGADVNRTGVPRRTGG